MLNNMICDDYPTSIIIKKQKRTVETAKKTVGILTVKSNQVNNAINLNLMQIPMRQTFFKLICMKRYSVE